MKRTGYEQTTEDCLEEMFKRVGAKYPWPGLTRYREWYNRRTWTEQEQADFGKWMKKLIMKRHRVYAKKAEYEVDMFLTRWGWKTKGEGR